LYKLAKQLSFGFPVSLVLHFFAETQINKPLNATDNYTVVSRAAR